MNIHIIVTKMMSRGKCRTYKLDTDLTQVLKSQRRFRSCSMSKGYMPYIQARHRSNPGPEKSKTIQKLFDVGL